jgi:hypothetical protein
MWTPLDIFFIMWHCNFAPCEDARLNVSKAIKQKENKLIAESVNLRNDF